MNPFLLENTDILKSNNLSPILIEAGLAALLINDFTLVSNELRSFIRNK